MLYLNGMRLTYEWALNMPLRCNVAVLLAKLNLQRVEAGGKPISVRGLAQATEISHSSLVNIVHNRTTRFDLDIIEKLMRFFNTRDISDIFVWIDE